MPTLTEQPAPEDLFRHVLRTLLPIVNADLGGFFVFDEDFDQVLLGTIEGEPPAESLTPVGVAKVPPTQVPAERWIREHQRPLHLYRLRDWQRFPPVNPGLRELALRGKLVALVIPLRSQDELVGVAYLWRHRHPRPFLRREIREAERWCQLAALVAIAGRLYEREAQARQALARVLAIDRSLTTASSHDAVGRAVVGPLADFLGVESLALWLRWGEDHKVFFQNIADETLRETLTTWEFSWSHFEQLTSRPQVVARDRARETLGPWVEALPNSVDHIILCSIRYDANVVALLVGWDTSSRSRRPPNTRHQMLEAAAVLLEQIAVTLVRLSFRAELERTISDLRSLLKVSQRVVSTPSVADLLEEVERVIRDRLRYDAMIFLEPDPDSPSALRVSWGSGTIPESRVGHRIPLDRSLAGWVFRTGRELLITDTWEDPRTYHRPGQPFPLRSLLLFPVRYEEQTIGVLGLGRKRVSPFSEYDRELASLIASELATTIRLIEQRHALRRQAHHQALLATVSQLLLRDFDPRSFAPPLVQQLSEWVGGSAALVLQCSVFPNRVVATVDALSSHRLPDLEPLYQSAFYEWLASMSSERALDLSDAVLAPAEFRAAFSEILAIFRTVLLVALDPDETPSGFLLLAIPEQLRAERGGLAATLWEVRNRVLHATERWIALLEQDSVTHLTLDLGAKSSSDAFARALLEKLSPLVRFDFAAVFDLDRERGRLIPLATTSHFDGLPAGWTLAPEIADFGAPSSEETLRYIPDTSTKDLGYALRFATAAHPSSLVFAPLVTQGDESGLLLVGRFGTHRFSQSERRRLAKLAAHAALAFHIVRVNGRERAIYRASVEALAAAVDAKDPATHDHSRRVARIARVIAEHLHLSREAIEEIELAALLHDIGKLAIPDHVLGKPGKLDPSEWALIRLHPSVGAGILANHPQLSRIVPLVRAHHERWDGRGYPDGLRGEEIPLGAAIIALADAFDTMISDRPYRPARRFADAIEEIRRGRGTQFHPAVVDAFFEALRDPNSLPILLLQHSVVPPTSLAAHAIHRVAEHLPHIPSVDALVEVIDLAISGTLSNDNIVIFLLDESETSLRILYSRHDRDLASTVQIPRGHGIAWQAIESNAPIAVIVPEAPPGTILKWETRDLYAVLAAPLVDHSRVVGALVVSRTEQRPFSTADAELLATLGRYLGPLLQTFLEDHHRLSSSDETTYINKPKNSEQHDENRLMDQIKHEAMPADPDENREGKHSFPGREGPPPSSSRIQPAAS